MTTSAGDHAMPGITDLVNVCLDTGRARRRHDRGHDDAPGVAELLGWRPAVSVPSVLAHDSDARRPVRSGGLHGARSVVTRPHYPGAEQASPGRSWNWMEV